MFLKFVITEFLEVGKKQPALDVLYDVIKSKKHRTWQKIHEPIMLKYLELCVDLRKSHLAKEGLYQYKNICQQVTSFLVQHIFPIIMHLWRIVFFFFFQVIDNSQVNIYIALGWSENSSVHALLIEVAML